MYNTSLCKNSSKYLDYTNVGVVTDDDDVAYRYALL